MVHNNTTSYLILHNNTTSIHQILHNNTTSTHLLLQNFASDAAQQHNINTPNAAQLVNQEEAAVKKALLLREDSLEIRDTDNLCL